MSDANSQPLQAQAENSFRVSCNMRLARLGMSKTALARRLKVSRQSVNLAINQAGMMIDLKGRVSAELTRLENERGLDPLP